MTGDPYKKVQVGEEVQFSASVQNGMIDAARAFKASQSDLFADQTAKFRQSGIIRVQNNSGRTIDRFGILGLDVPLFDAYSNQNVFLNEVLFSGVVPTSAHVGSFAILNEPALDGAIVKAFVSGVCPVRIDVVEDGHRFAECLAGDTEALVSSDEGSVRILWKEPDGYTDGGYDPYYGANTRWAYCAIGHQGESATIARVTASTIAAMGADGTYSYGTAVLQYDNGTKLIDSPGQPPIYVKNMTDKTITGGATSWVVCVHAMGSWWVIAIFNCALLT